MANHKSAEKRIRQTARRTAVNKKRKTPVNASVKKLEAAIASGDKKAAMAALKAAQSSVMKGVAKGLIKKGTASRNISRLSARVKKMAT